ARKRQWLRAECGGSSWRDSRSLAGQCATCETEPCVARPLHFGEGRRHTAALPCAAMTTTRTSRLTTDAALERRLARLGLTGHEDDWTDRYLLCEHLVEPATAKARQRFEAVARFCRDLIAHRWVKTRETRELANPKRVFYLSMEFLIGRALLNNIMNM